VWADTAYRSRKNEAFLVRNGFTSQVHRKKPVGRPDADADPSRQWFASLNRLYFGLRIWGLLGLCKVTLRRSVLIRACAFASLAVIPLPHR
jgi:hypothetical protein